MDTIKLTIPNMKSSHCQITVSEAVASTGAKVTAVAPGEIEVVMDGTPSVERVIAVIEQRGYRVSR